MTNSGYPTPDNPVGQMDFICKSIFVPNDDAFIACLAGQINEMTKAWYWQKVGTMTPEQAADYAAQGIAMIDWDLECGIMSCEQIADCIETNTTVQAAIQAQNVSDNDLYGTSNPDYLSPAGTENTTIINNRFPPAERDMPAKELVACNLDELWAGIYFMVQQLDSVGRDWLEQAVASGDKWQRAASIVKNIPIIGSLAETALEQLAEVAQDLLNLYNAYSTETVLQEIACDLFEMVCSECRYPTFQEISDYYSQNSTITGGNLAEISLKAMVDFLIGSSLAISQLAYHTIISMVLFTLYIGSEFVGLRGQKWIPIWLDNGEEYANDEWIVLCDGCEPPEVLLEIGLGDCAMGAIAGICTQTGFNQYQITSTLRGADRAVMLRRVGSTDNWRVVNAFHQSGTPVKFRRWCTDGVISPIGQLSGGIPNVCLDSLGITVDDSDSDFTYIIEVEAC